MRLAWLAILAAVVSSTGCTTDQMGGLLAGMKQGREAVQGPNPPSTTYCNRIGDQMFCRTQ